MTRPTFRGEKSLERETGFEPATSTLARSHSTTELFPPEPPKYHTAAIAFKHATNSRGSAQIERLGTAEAAPYVSPYVSALETDGTQHPRRLFGRRRIDVEPGPPFETGDARELRHDLDVPVVLIRDVL
jgi:hypothetical protein